MMVHIKSKLWIMPVFFHLLLMSEWVAAEEKHERESCRVCGMWIDEYQKIDADTRPPSSAARRCR